MSATQTDEKLRARKATDWYTRVSSQITSKLRLAQLCFIYLLSLHCEFGDSLLFPHRGFET